MIVSIHQELFSLQNHSWVESVMSFFYEERHIWFIDNEEAIFESEWFRENTPNKQQIIRDNIEKCISHYENERTYYLNLPLFSIDTQSQNTARTILQAPLYLITEGDSDRIFLNRLVDKFVKVKNHFAEKIKVALQNHWAIVVGGGGNNWEKEMNNLYLTYRNHRIFVLSDSDKLFSTHESPKNKSVKKECTKKNIPFHVLYKREVENYLPLKAVEIFAKDIGKSAIYEDFKALSHAERDFYDMENGFLAGTEREYFNIQQANGLFISLTDAQISRLATGFGNKSKIMTYFSDSITANDLIEHCKHHPILAHQHPKGEMIDLLSKIAKAL